MARLPVTTTLLGLEVTSEPLPFARAEPLIPEVLEFISVVLQQGAGLVAQFFATKQVSIQSLDVEMLGAVGMQAAKYFGAGRLQRLAPLIMFSTSVPMRMLNGNVERKELGKDADRNYVFDEHPEAFFPILFFAGSVTFKRFFPASLWDALRGDATQSEQS